MTTTSRIARDWAIRCFGLPHVEDKHVRAMRFLEEALELAQSLGVSKEEADRISAMVHLCGTIVVDPELEFERELRRVLGKTSEHFKARNDEKIKELK